MNSLGTLLVLIGAALCAAEIVSGTFYLFAFGSALLLAGGAELAWRLGATADLGLATLLSLLFLVVAHRLRRRLSNAASERTAQDDSGHEVEVTRVDTHALRVRYRGTEWAAVLADGGEAHVGEQLRILRREGNRLILAPLPATPVSNREQH
ncbi:NfeD family protein [Acidihalobacter yilgarnensis]|nr:NfeD family protein [Acidihalobacter yilgarnensis]